jgi:hypothetical protein
MAPHPPPGLGIVGLMTAGGITVGAALQWEATP